MAPPPKNSIAVANFGSTSNSGALSQNRKHDERRRAVQGTERRRARAANRFRSLSTKTDRGEIEPSAIKLESRHHPSPCGPIVTRNQATPEPRTKPEREVPQCNWRRRRPAQTLSGPVSTYPTSLLGISPSSTATHLHNVSGTFPALSTNGLWVGQRDAAGKQPSFSAAGKDLVSRHPVAIVMGWGFGSSLSGRDQGLAVPLHTTWQGPSDGSWCPSYRVRWPRHGVRARQARQIILDGEDPVDVEAQEARRGWIWTFSGGQILLRRYH